MRLVIAGLLLALPVAASAAGKFSCYEEPGTMKHWCYDPTDVRENGSVRMSPLFIGGPKGVKRAGLFFVVDCSKKLAAMQDEKGVNFGANYASATPISQNLSGWICEEPKVKKDATVRLY